MAALIQTLRKATPQITLSSQERIMKLSLQSEADGSVRMRLEGRVSQRDLQLSDPFTDTLGDQAYGRNVTLDMGDVLSLDSSGVNWLLISQKKMREAGGQLVLPASEPRVDRAGRIHTFCGALASTSDQAGWYQIAAHTAPAERSTTATNGRPSASWS